MTNRMQQILAVTAVEKFSCLWFTKMVEAPKFFLPKISISSWLFELGEQ
jgi:hypothetical protein